MPGTGAPSRTRPASAGRSVVGTGRPISADGSATDRRSRAGTGTAPRARGTRRAAAARPAGGAPLALRSVVRRRAHAARRSRAARHAARFELGERAPLRAVVEHDPGDQRSTTTSGDRVGRDDEDGVRAEIHHEIMTRFRRGLRLHQHQRAHAAAQDLVAHGGEMQRDEQQREGQRHHQQRHQDRRIDRRAAEAQHRGRLMQRVPPVDRELDDRQVDRADQRQDRGGAAGARRVLDGAPQRDARRDTSGTAPAPRSAARPTPNRCPTSAGPTASR